MNSTEKKKIVCPFCEEADRQTKLLNEEEEEEAEADRQRKLLNEEDNRENYFPEE